MRLFKSILLLIVFTPLAIFSAFAILTLFCKETYEAIILHRNTPELDAILPLYPY